MLQRTWQGLLFRIACLLPAPQMHTVLYDDGDEEELALAFEQWVFADGRQQGRPAPQPLALMGSWDLGPAEEGQQAQQGPPPKRARTEEPQGGFAVPQADLLRQVPGGPASQQPRAHPAQPAVGLSSGLPPAAAPPSSRAATPQLPSDFLLFPATPAAPVQLPPRLVASGRNYRVFTSGVQPDGFELFMLLPGLSIEEASWALRRACCREADGHPMRAEGGPLLPASRRLQVRCR